MPPPISEILLFALPPFIVNASFNLIWPLSKRVGFIARLDRPIDFNKTLFDGKRIFGDSTTFAGIIFAILVGPLIGIVFYKSAPLGLTIGLFTYLGHALGSFIKRRLGIPRGKFLPLIDHGDYIMVNGIFFLWMNIINIQTLIIALLFVLILQPVVCYVTYRFGLRERPI